MSAALRRPALLALHLALGLVIGYESVMALTHALSRHHDPHLAILAGLESAACLLFLVPKTVRLGGWLLTAILTFAFVVHLTRGEFQSSLLLYALATLYVTVSGGAWGSGD